MRLKGKRFVDKFESDSPCQKYIADKKWQSG
jgi:hypothetical protein